MRGKETTLGRCNAPESEKHPCEGHEQTQFSPNSSGPSTTDVVDGAGAPPRILTQEEARRFGPAQMAELAELGCSHSEQLVYYHLRSLYSATGKVFISLEGLRKNMGGCAQTIRSGIRRLETRGLILVVGREGATSTYYPLHFAGGGTPPEFSGGPTKNWGGPPPKFRVDS